MTTTQQKEHEKNLALLNAINSMVMVFELFPDSDRQDLSSMVQAVAERRFLKEQ